MDFLYSSLLALVAVLSAPWWLFRMAQSGKYRAGIGERLGHVPARLRSDARPAIWIHAVSVGEALAVAGLVQRLQVEFPEHRVLISTTTKTGQELARKRFGDENVFYFPLDFAFCIRPFMRAIRPSLVVLAETEFWPNFLRLARASGANVAVVNARISDRSFPRYRRWRRMLRRVLGNIDVFCAQTEQDAHRLREIGAAAERVHVSGNLKFDVQPPKTAPIVEQLRNAIQQGGAGPVIVAGSTVEGEEELLLRDFQQLIASKFPKSLLILAPRHPERFSSVAQVPAFSQGTFAHRSEWKETALCAGVFLLDSIGELASTYALAEVAIVGGSFAARGGHNILEPAWFAKPIITGPHYENFREIVDHFVRADAIVVTEEPMAAAAVLLRDMASAREIGSRARAAFDAMGGATDRTLDLLRNLMPERSEHEAAR